MERTRKIKKADAILTGDWHLREDTPVCRKDDFQQTLWDKVDFISNLQKEHDCYVLHSGDLFNHWKPSPFLLAKTIQHLPAKFWTIYGNHDLPQHNLDLADRCGINVLREAGVLSVLHGTHWRQKPEAPSMIFPLAIPYKNSVLMKVLMWHVMTYQGVKPWPDCTDPISAALLRKYKYDLILTGHNHKTFVEEYHGRLLINPGSISRQEAGQMDHKPCVFLWYAESNTYKQVFLPIPDGAISREHLDIQELREGRIDSFISRLDTDWEAALSFEENLQTFEKTNKVRKSVMEIVYKSLE